MPRIFFELLSRVLFKTLKTLINAQFLLGGQFYFVAVGKSVLILVRTIINKQIYHLYEYVRDLIMLKWRLFSLKQIR